jgi:hypothetical protein
MDELQFPIHCSTCNRDSCRSLKGLLEGASVMCDGCGYSLAIEVSRLLDCLGESGLVSMPR